MMWLVTDSDAQVAHDVYERRLRNGKVPDMTLNTFQSMSIYP
jgi:hypothetical protein